MTPFLVASFLAYQRKTMFTQDVNDLFGCANREALAHVSATSKTFAPAGKSTGAGSNQSSRASFAFWIASSSVSPAEAQPGNSGKNAAQRFVSESCSTTKRNFIELIIDQNGTEQKRRLPRCRSYQQGRSRCDNQTPMWNARMLDLKLARCQLTRRYPRDFAFHVADPSGSILSLATCSMSLIPSAPLQAGHIANIFQK